MAFRTGPEGDGTDRPGSPAPTRTPAQRLRRNRREEALRQLGRAHLATAYAADEDVVLGRSDVWRWSRDGIPEWLVPYLQDAGLLPEEPG